MDETYSEKNIFEFESNLLQSQQITMADGQANQDKNSWESWLGGWVQAAKEKSSTALEFVKKDLAEFTCTMQKETEKAVEKTIETLNKEKTTQATNKVKAGFSSFLDNISKVLVIPPDDDYVPMKVAADGSGLYDRGKARLHAIQLDAGTYMDPPKGPPEQYNMWLESFDMDKHKGEISELLVSKVEVRALYTRMVPGEVSHAEFWQRYFYRVHQLECDEARKQALMKRAEQARGDSLGWDDEEDWSGAEEEDPHSDREKVSRQPQLSHSGQKITVIKPEPPQRADEYEPEPQKKTELVTQIDPQKQTEPQTESEPQTRSTEITTVDQKEHLLLTEVKDLLPDKLSESVNNATPTEDAAKVGDEPEEAYFAEPLDSHAVDVPLRQTVEVSDDLTHLSQLNNPPLTNLWSLHIPEDVPKADFVDTGSKPSFVLDDQTTLVSKVTEQETVKDSSGVTTNESSTCLADKPSVPNLVLNVETLVSAKQTTQKLEADESLTQVCVSPDSTSPFESVPVPDPSACLEPKMTQAKVDSSESSEETSESSLEHVTLEGNSDNNTCHSDCPQDQDVNDINISVKGDMVLVGERISPLSDNSETKELGQEDDWEQDFDIEITEDDLKAADNIAKKLSENLNMDADDWENWE
ncbi:BSD domain-containing protein 1-like isoform X3 [Biomphalaria glabrata]